MRFDNGKIHVSSTELKALVAHTRKEKDYRPLVSCVHFVSVDARAYATDGNRIATVKAPAPVSPGTVVSVRAVGLQNLVKFPGAVRFEIWPDADGRKATAAAHGPLFELGHYRLELDEAPIPAAFAAYAAEPKVDGPRQPLFCLDLGYLADLRAVHAAAKEVGLVEDYFVAPGGPYEPLTYVAGTWQVTVMPKRSDAATKSGELMDAWKTKARKA